MRYAVIDVGSNTIRLCIYEKHDGGLSLIVNERVMALLGSKTTNGALNEEGIRAATEALLKLKEIAEREQAEADAYQPVGRGEERALAAPERCDGEQEGTAEHAVGEHVDRDVGHEPWALQGRHERLVVDFGP